MSRRNAHAVAARQRKAGPHREDYVFQCDECGKDMGFRPPSHLCAPCQLGIRPDEEETCPVNATYEAEYKVVEAAKATKPDLRRYMERHFELFGNPNPYYKHPFSKLLGALEALEEVERE